MFNYAIYHLLPEQSIAAKWLPHLHCIPVVSCLPGKKVKKLVFQALSEEGTKREEHKREGICFNDLTSRWIIYSKTLCTIAGWWYYCNFLGGLGRKFKAWRRWKKGQHVWCKYLIRNLFLCCWHSGWILFRHINNIHKWCFNSVCCWCEWPSAVTHLQMMQTNATLDGRNPAIISWYGRWR